MSIAYITISSDLKDEGTDSSATMLVPPSPDYVPASPNYVPALHPKGIHFMFTPRKTVRAPYTLTPSIEATIVELIVAPTRGQLLAIGVRYNPCSIEIDESYTVAKATQQDMETLQATLVATRERISDLESRLDESKASEAALERRIRAMEKRFGPSSSKRVKEDDDQRILSEEQSAEDGN
ncbi:hypothetical protein Tco_0508320 [Tanacetum coccineum]